MKHTTEAVGVMQARGLPPYPDEEGVESGERAETRGFPRGTLPLFRDLPSWGVSASRRIDRDPFATDRSHGEDGDAIAAPRVLFVDNFDSFTFNLVDEFARRGCEVEVFRNTVPASRLIELAGQDPPAGLFVLSPGPGRPAEAGCCVELVRLAAGKVPLLGVCLGHQALVEAFGGAVGPAPEPLHGRSSLVVHGGDPLFEGVPSPFPAGRYHSLAGVPAPGPIEAIAWSGPIVMAARHRRLPLIGVQFHPESILTPHGGRIVENVLREATAWRREPGEP